MKVFGMNFGKQENKIESPTTIEDDKGNNYYFSHLYQFYPNL